MNAFARSVQKSPAQKIEENQKLKKFDEKRKDGVWHVSCICWFHGKFNQCK